MSAVTSGTKQNEWIAIGLGVLVAFVGWLALLCSMPVPTVLVTLLLCALWFALRDGQRRQETTAHPEIARFVGLYWDPTACWPMSVTIFPEDVTALHTILAGKGLSLRRDRLDDLVQHELSAQLDAQFCRSFERHSPQCTSFTRANQWAAAYVSIFEHDTRYLPYLLRMVRARRLRLRPAELDALVQAEIRHRAERRRVQAVSHAMATGTRVQRRRVTIEDVDLMDGLEFERFLGDLFRAMGYQSRVTKASGDQGADLIIEKFGDRTVVQAKRYSGTVSNSAVQEAVAAKAHYPA
jgi:Restriction endonuclease